MTPPRMFFWKSSAWTVQKQLSTAIHFRKFLWKIPVVESFFWSNYGLVNQSSDYVILKWLHQECFLGNLLKAFGAPKHYRLYIFEVMLFLVAKVTSCNTLVYINQIFPWIIFFSVSSQEICHYIMFQLAWRKKLLDCRRATSLQRKSKISQF